MCSCPLGPPQVWAARADRGVLGAGHCHSTLSQRHSPWHRVGPSRRLSLAFHLPGTLECLSFLAEAALPREELGAVGLGEGVGEVVPSLHHPGRSFPSLGPDFSICVQDDFLGPFPVFPSLGLWACCTGDLRGEAAMRQGPLRKGLGESGHHCGLQGPEPVLCAFPDTFLQGNTRAGDRGRQSR